MIPFSELIGAWFVVFFTLCIFSMLYKDNFFFKLVEYLYIGISLGYYASMYIFQSLKPKVWIPLTTDISSTETTVVAIIAFALGMLIFARFIPKLQWLSRWMMAFLLGYTAGYVIPTAIDSFLLTQISDTIKPVGLYSEGNINWAGIQNLIIFIGVTTALLYFFFSAERKGVLKITSGIGILFIVIFLGSLYGKTVMGRLSLLYYRFNDLITFSGSDYYYSTYITLIALVIFFAISGKRRKSMGPEA